MFKMLHFGTAVDSNEEEYRGFYCKSDVNRSRLAMLLFAVPIAGFVVNDYMFYGVSLEFFGFAALRAVLLLVTAIEFVYVTRVKSYHSYDLMLFSAALLVFGKMSADNEVVAMASSTRSRSASAVIMTGGGIINALRPQNFVVQMVITIVSVFVLYLVVPFRFSYQSILSSAATIGESLIVLFILKPIEPAITFTLLFSMLLANLIAAISS